MNEKEISEIRRRFRADKSNITHVRGCYVNEKQEIVSQFDQPLSLLPQEECENMLSVLRRTLSGTLGKNLIEMPFTTAQVIDSDEHRLLMALRDSKLTDEEAVRMFFEKVIASYRPEGTYLILLANDTYDVPYRAKDGETLEDASENIYNYVLCTVCPVKQTKPVLGYDVPENTFHNRNIDWLVSAPQLGFLFPSFTDRSADIYSAMYYCRSASESYDEFIDAVFNREAPMPAEEQKTTFGTILGDALNDACSLDVVQTVHSRLCGMIEEHKASKDPEPLTITGRTMKTMLMTLSGPLAACRARRPKNLRKPVRSSSARTRHSARATLWRRRNSRSKRRRCKFASTPSTASGSRRATLTVHRISSFPPARACR